MAAIASIGRRARAISHAPRPTPSATTAPPAAASRHPKTSLAAFKGASGEPITANSPDLRMCHNKRYPACSSTPAKPSSKLESPAYARF